MRNPWLRLVAFLVAMAALVVAEAERVVDDTPPPPTQLQQLGGDP